ncbi:MAG: hypothetical protein ACRDFB_08120, partial [Rhabdochlamydiaceae bacterium]
MKQTIIIEDPREQKLRKELENRTDIKAERIKRLLNKPDLIKKEHSPVKILVDQIIKLPRFANFDWVDNIPRIVTVEQNFDILNSPKDHPSRRETDTYYLDAIHLLRPQMTVMWYFYLRNPEVLERLKKDGEVGALAAGTVFRKDEIDRKHAPYFHQIDGLYICRKDKKIIAQKDLENVLIDVAQSIFGNDIEYKFAVDSFP